MNPDGISPVGDIINPLLWFRRQTTLAQSYIAGTVFFLLDLVYLYVAGGFESYRSLIYQAFTSALIFLATYYFVSVILRRQAGHIKKGRRG